MLRIRRTPADLVLWGLTPIFGILGTLHQEQRLRKQKPAFYFEQTSHMPFYAIATGKQSFGNILHEFSPASYAAGLGMLGISYFRP